MKLLKADITKISEADYRSEYDRLSDYQKKKIDRIMLDDDKKLSLAGMLLMRKGFKNFFSRDKFTIKYNDNGKPFVDFCGFNISHSGKLAVCAFSEKEIGTDVEIIREIKERPEYKFFSASESRFINSDNEKRSIRFLTLWTMKEAYIKLNGGNLSDIAGCCFEIKNDEVVKAFNDCLFSTQIIGGYIISICERVS